ncbi:hypothetical protein K9M79_03090, partial [Candidatus Woesearchaeota archaeon]|nr:hypothetical protein [Candidatus Woesearchaeota archaeon]
MAERFEIEVPIDMTGKGSGTGKGSSSSDSKDNSTDKLAKGVFEGVSILKILSSLLKDTVNLLMPLVRVLSILLMVIFLPLMPLIVFLTKAIADFVKVITSGGAEGIIAWFIGLLTVIGIILFAIFGGWILGLLALVGLIIIFFWEYIKIALIAIWDALVAIWNGIIAVLQWAWEMLVKGWSLLGNVAMWIWDNIIKPGFMPFVNAAMWIWDKILAPAFGVLKDIGLWIWNIIKTPFEWLRDGLVSMLNTLIGTVNKLIPGKRFDIPKLASGGIVTSPTIAMIGEAGPEAVIPLGKGGTGGNVIINNPIMTDSSFIKKVTDQVSKV